MASEAGLIQLFPTLFSFQAFRVVPVLQGDSRMST